MGTQTPKAQIIMVVCVVPLSIIGARLFGGRWYGGMIGGAIGGAIGYGLVELFKVEGR